MNNILVVEDEKWVRLGIVTRLENFYAGKFNIYQACNGEEALEQIRLNRMDIVVTDIRMPRMDGLELLSKIYEMDRRIKLIVISGYADFAYAKEAIHVNAVEYILKPISDTQFIDAIDKAVSLLDESENVENVRAKLELQLIGLLNGKSDATDFKYLENSIYRNLLKQSYYALTLIEAEDGHSASELQSAASQSLSGINGSCICFPNAENNRELIILIGMDDKASLKNELQSAAAQIQSDIASKLMRSVHIGKSNVASSISDELLRSARDSLNINIMLTLPVTGEQFNKMVLDYIDRNYKEQLTASKVAAKFAISPNYFSAIFSKNNGVTFTQHLLNVRIDNACKLLDETSFTSEQISKYVGFTDAGYFYRIFKRIKGTTPQAYRAREK